MSLPMLFLIVFLKLSLAHNQIGWRCCDLILPRTLN